MWARLLLFHSRIIGQYGHSCILSVSGQRASNIIPRCISNINTLFNTKNTYCLFYKQSKLLHFSHSRNSSAKAVPGVMADNKYGADYDKRGQASCKKCKQKLGKQALRIAKLTSNPFSEDAGEMKQYFHPSCIFETFIKARATTKIIDDTDMLQGFGDLEDTDKKTITKLIEETLEKKNIPKKATAKKATTKNTVQATLTRSPSKNVVLGASIKDSSSKKDTPETSTGKARHVTPISSDPDHRDNSFRQFRRICADIAEESSYLEKTKTVSIFVEKGSSGDGFQGDLYLVLKLLLPGVVKTVYNLNNKQLVKIFSQIFRADLDAMTEDVNQGDVAETVKIFFEDSRGVKPAAKSTLNVQDVDALLSELSDYTRAEDQQRVLTKIAKKCTLNDLKMVVRLIKHDLRINAGAKHVLEGLDANAYDAFQASRDLRDVVDRVIKLRKESHDKPGLSKRLSVRANLMTPVLPMLAEACKSVEMALKKCPNGMYAEIKYDGERVQVHKQGDSFSYYSRSLKPVQPHKVNHFKEWIPKAFPDANDLILDCEVLLIDTKTGNPLPFGSLGVHKKTKFQDANVCLFIFDCLHYNGENLMDMPIKKRRKYLDSVMKEIPNRILFSEMNHITEAAKLREMMARVFNEGLEGLVLKDVNSTYEPGKRHWLKVKKDYLQEGAMADSSDLIVLGAYYGTGSKGGIMSVFLMGCYDPTTKNFVTVTKCGNGFDDNTLDRLQGELKPNMKKIDKDYVKVPNWLNINRGNIVPDFVVKDPKNSPVWEISGAEFSHSDIHTADGISIRFPRCTKMRDDKGWKDATDLRRLKELVKISKERTDFGEMLGASPSKTKKTAKRRSSSESDGDVPTTSSGNAKKTPLKKLPSKRSSPSVDNGDDSEPPSKKTKPESKPLCKYGEGCYQTNPKHQTAFSHDVTSEIATKSNKKLPDIFQGLTFYLSDKVKDKQKLRRYIVAYDGDVAPDYDKDSATHVVTSGAGEEDGLDGSHVTEDWVWNCIKHKQIQPIEES